MLFTVSGVLEITSFVSMAVLLPEQASIFRKKILEMRISKTRIQLY